MNRRDWALAHAEKLIDRLEIPDDWDARVRGEAVETFAPRPDYWSRRAAPGVDIVPTAPDFQSVLTNVQSVGVHYADTDSFEECVEVGQQAIEDVKNALREDEETSQKGGFREVQQ